MRSFALWLCLMVLLPMTRGQEQESKLVDRLLKPDMELQNEAQQKKFSADHGGTIDKKATVGSFYLQEKKNDKKATVGSFYLQEKKNGKKFAATRDVSTRKFGSENFRGSKEAAIAKPQREIVNANRAVPTAGVRDVRAAHDSNKIVDSREYAGKRPFLERGKSQKSLDRQNPPMTIDQVRELLNKNK